jgi:hypothetical protein
MLSLESYGSRMKKTLPTDPFRITQGLRGYTHWARSRTPFVKETRSSLTRLQFLPRARGFPEPWAPKLWHDQAWSLAPARLTMPAKARAQEDKPQATNARVLSAITKCGGFKSIPDNGARNAYWRFLAHY